MSYIENALERTDGETLILANGSKWAGDSPDGIHKLLDVLEKETLDPSFEKYHCYNHYPYRLDAKLNVDDKGSKIYPWIGAPMFFGNFRNVSHVFRIVTKDPAVIKALTDAINRNMESEAYQKAAFELYADWFYVQTVESYKLVSPRVADDIRLGNITKERYPRNYYVMKTARLIGPRFAASGTTVS